MKHYSKFVKEFVFNIFTFSDTMFDCSFNCPITLLKLSNLLLISSIYKAKFSFKVPKELLMGSLLFNVNAELLCINLLEDYLSFRPSVGPP